MCEVRVQSVKVWHRKFLMIVDGITSCFTPTVTLAIRLFLYSPVVITS